MFLNVCILMQFSVCLQRDKVCIMQYQIFNFWVTKFSMIFTKAILWFDLISKHTQCNRIQWYWAGFHNDPQIWSWQLRISHFHLLVPLQAGGELVQRLEEVRSSSSGLLAQPLPPPAQLLLLDVIVLNLLEQLGHHLQPNERWANSN